MNIIRYLRKLKQSTTVEARISIRKPPWGFLVTLHTTYTATTSRMAGTTERTIIIGVVIFFCVAVLELPSGVESRPLHLLKLSNLASREVYGILTVI